MLGGLFQNPSLVGLVIEGRARSQRISIRELTVAVSAPLSSFLLMKALSATFFGTQFNPLLDKTSMVGDRQLLFFALVILASIFHIDRDLDVPNGGVNIDIVTNLFLNVPNGILQYHKFAYCSVSISGDKKCASKLVNLPSIYVSFNVHIGVVKGVGYYFDSGHGRNI